MESNPPIKQESSVGKKAFLAGLGGSGGVIIGIVLIVLLLCCGCIFIVSMNMNNNGSGTLKIDEVNSSSDTVKQPTNITAAKYKIGDVIEMGDLQLTVYSIEDNVKSTNTFFQPEEGNKFIAVDVKVSNKGTTIENANPYDFEIKDSDDYSFNYSWYNIKTPEFNASDLNANDSVRGWLTFEVPSTSKDYRLVYQPSWLSADQIIVELF